MRIALALLLVLLGFAIPAMAEKRVALVVAADDYRLLRPLANAVNDGRAIEAALEKIGFSVTLETNRDLRRMRRALEDFRDDAAGADVALVFFSGHGVEMGGDNLLLPVDADPASPERLKATSLPLEEVRATVAGIAGIGLIVLDACRNDPFGLEAGAGGRGATAIAPETRAAAKPGLARMGRAENTLFAFSAAPGQTASDGARGNSDFTTALAKFLPTEGLEIRSVLTLVQQEVYDLSRGRQLPYVESGLPKLFFAAQTGRELPERDRLLLAMADITPDLRGEVETIAASADMPLAPLYAALIRSKGSVLREGERRRKLQEAADAFVQVRADLRKLASSDPRVTVLRQEAETQLALGAFANARAKLTQAAGIDGESREDLKASFIERTLSEATTHYLNGSAARAELRYDLAIVDYDRAAALYTDVAGFDLPDDARYQHALALEFVGTLQRTVGNLPAAAAAFEAMAKAVERRIAARPDVLAHRRDLVVARNMAAEVKLTMGDTAGAIALYEAGRATLMALIEREPRGEFLRDLAVSYNRTGDARRISGNPGDALKEYQAALKVTQYLVEQLPDDALIRRDLGVSWSKIELAQMMMRDFDGSLASYESALSVSEALLKATPDDMELQRDMTVSLNAIGDLRRFAGTPAEALEPYGRSVEISRALVARDPSNTLWRRDLSVGLAKLGDAKSLVGDRPGALGDYRSALALAEYLAALDPTNAEWQRDLSVSHNKVGDALAAGGDRDGASAQFRAGFDIALAMANADPSSVQRKLDLAFSRYKLASAGVDPLANLEAARADLMALKQAGRLPAINESWLANIEAALAALPPN